MKMNRTNQDISPGWLPPRPTTGVAGTAIREPQVRESGQKSFMKTATPDHPGPFTSIFAGQSGVVRGGRSGVAATPGWQVRTPGWYHPGGKIFQNARTGPQEGNWNAP